MINNVILVGRVVEQPSKIFTEKNQTFATLVLAVPRPFKNLDGVVETDFIKCIVWEGLVETVCSYCTKGSVVGVKGRISPYNNEVFFNEDKKVVRNNEIVVENISFIKMISTDINK